MAEMKGNKLMASLKGGRKRFEITAEGFSGINSTGAASFKKGESSEMINFRVTENHFLKKRSGYRYLMGINPNKYPVKGLWYTQLKMDLKPYIYFTRTEENDFGSALCVKKYDLDSGQSYNIFDLQGTKEALVFFKNGFLYILGDIQYFKYDGRNYLPVAGTIPILYYGVKPDLSDMESKAYQPVNMLCSDRKIIYTATGATIYSLPEKNITEVKSVISAGTLLTENTQYTVNKTDGRISFLSGAIPASGAQVCIIYRVYNDDKRIEITNCINATFYGGSEEPDMFIWGNPNLKNKLFYSYGGDVEYFAEGRSRLIGNGNDAVTDCVVQNAKLVIFTESEIYSAAADINKMPDKSSAALYSFSLIKSERGNILRGGVRIIDNCPVFISKNNSIYRLEAASYRDDRAAVLISQNIQEALSGLNLSEAATIDYESRGEFIIACCGKAVIYNYRNESWYIYDNIPASSLAVINDELYFGTDDGCIAKFEDYLEYDIKHDLNGVENNIRIEAYWLSPFINCQDELHSKSLKGFFLKLMREQKREGYVRLELSTADGIYETKEFLADSGNYAEQLYADLCLINTKGFRVRIISDKICGGAVIAGLTLIGCYGGYLGN